MASAGSCARTSRRWKEAGGCRPEPACVIYLSILLMRAGNIRPVSPRVLVLGVFLMLELRALRHVCQMTCVM